MLTKKEQSLVEALEKRATHHQIDIVSVECTGAKKAPTIRVYIDSENGVSFDELSSSQVWINEVMDEIDPFPGAYTLEVSSPGIDRPLRTPAHFKRFVGSTVVVQTTSPFEGRSKWTGTLVNASEDAVKLETDDLTTEIAYDMMKRAHLKGAIDFST